MLLRQLIPAHFHASAVFRQLSEKTHYDMYSFIAADHLDYHRYEGGGAGGAGGGAGGGGGAGAEGSRSTTASTSLTQLGSAEGGGGCDAAAASFARTFWRDRIDCADDLEAAVRTLAAWQFDLVPEFVVQFCVAHNVHAHARLRILADTASDATVATVALDLLIHTPPPTPCSSSSISSSSSDARPEEPEEPEEEPAAADKDLTEEEAWRAQLRAAPAVWPQTTLDFVNARRGGGGDDAALLVFLGDKLELAAAAGEKEWCRTLTLLVAGRRGLSRAAWARHSALVRHAQPALARLLLSRRDRSEEDDEVALCALTAALAAGASGNDADELWLAAAAAPAGALRVLLDRGRPCGRAARAEVADALCRHAASDADLCAAALLHGAGPLWARAAAKHSRTHLFRACLLHAVDSWDTDDATDVAFAAVDAGADACVGLLCAALTTPPPELWMRRACRAARARTIAVLISNGGILSRDMADLALCNHRDDDDDAWRAFVFAQAQAAAAAAAARRSWPW